MYANKVGIMHESKGQDAGKATSLHLHTTVRAWGQVHNLYWQFMTVASLSGYFLLPCGLKASMTHLVELCYTEPLQQLKRSVGVGCRLMIVLLIEVHGMVLALSPGTSPTCRLRNKANMI